MILLMALAVVGAMLMQKWEEDYGKTPTVDVREIVPQQEQKKPLHDLPEIPSTSSKTAAIAELPKEAGTQSTDETIEIETDVYNIKIALKGGGLDQVKLKKYPVTREEQGKPLVLMDKTAELFYILQGGLLSKTESPSHDSVFSVKQKKFSLLAGNETLEVPLYWQSESGLVVEKVYRFHKNSYLIEIEYRIHNKSESSWQGRAYGQIQRNDPNRNGRRLLYTYTGTVFSSPEKRYEKISFEDMEEEVLQQEVKGGWVAMLQHYFVSALLPESEDLAYYYYTKALPQQDRYMIGAMTPSIEVASGESRVIRHKAYVGPKIHERLAKVNPGLELTVDFGVLWFIAKPLFVCLNWFHTLIGNWGWSIILVTVLLKLIFYPLSAAGYRSMANMRRVQPRLLAMRERYKNDKARLNQAMMELYKEEKINPLGGCFPILIQIPVFIALYWVLLESVEMRQAPFLLWLQDLSSPDPWYVLPVLMGITMYAQQKLNPAPMDPVQEKIMSFLPLFFTVFFAFFPSGLVLYWVSNNILSIAQQARINHTLEKAGLK